MRIDQHTSLDWSCERSRRPRRNPMFALQLKLFIGMQTLHPQTLHIQRSTPYSQARYASHALGSSHTDCSVIFVRLKGVCHLVSTWGYKRCWTSPLYAQKASGETRCIGRAGARGKCARDSSRKGKFEVSCIRRSESLRETQCIVFI